MRLSKLKTARLAIFFDSYFRCGLPSSTQMGRQFRVRTPLSAPPGVCLLMLCFFLWAIAQPAFAALPHHPNHELHKEIETLEMQWRQAQLSNDVAVMDRLLADDYIGISASGTIETKPEALALRRAGTLHITTLDLNDLKVRIYGDTAVVTSQANLAGTNGASDISGKYRYTRVYNRRFGQWKIVSFEASRIHDSNEREKH
ncbi:nuclear transport factor 2 family protein [Alloacidobacterium dinghuense]|uniref:Nuclear transport factor 2 family protein n=1 Tax=Alloacidobacterium dinghuense TaxID=2763107 RepID=A0A7G8BFD6_9BACT|nr:nuclear transport factor 2 family protein [Alloacidobacterium dinghuense]QNI31256.1 nuclear transport factor 2 family protein [Alloacidobacterium dinghuense]